MNLISWLKWILTRMRLAPKLVCFVLLFVNVSCLPGPDQGAYHFSKTVWATKKGASSPDVKIGEFRVHLFPVYWILVLLELKWTN